MRTVLSFILCIMLSPFLVCDPQIGVDYYNIYQNGIKIGSEITAELDGSLKYDLALIQPGVYDWTVEACNVWGCAITPDPFVSPGIMSIPVNLHLIK